MSEKIKIILPIKKAYFITFLNSLIPIHFFKDDSITIESLKNLLFPTTVSDEEFNTLVKFIFELFDELIKNNKDKILIEKDLKKNVFFKLNYSIFSKKIYLIQYAML